MKKYWLGVLCVCCMLLTLPAAFASEADAPPDTDAAAATLSADITEADAGEIDIAALLAANVGGGPCGADNPDDLYWILDEDGVMTFVGSGAMADYASVEKSFSKSYYYVTTAPWFSYREKIKSVVIPQGVTRIGAYAFYGNYTSGQYGFSALTSVTISDSVTSIGNYAFYNCDTLKEISIPGNVTAIGKDAFAYSDGLTAVTLNEGLTAIGDDAFYSCSKLASMTLPLSATSFGGTVFYGCSALTLKVYQGSDGWKYALRNNVRMTEDGSETVYLGGGSCGAKNSDDLFWRVDVDGTMTFVGSGAMADYKSEERTFSKSYYYVTTAPWFSYREKIKSVVIPNGVTRIGAYAFYGNYTSAQYGFSALTSVTISDSVTSIGNYAFYNCDTLKEISIPGNVTAIGKDAFAYSDGLTAVTLNEGLTTIGEGAFYGCSKLASMTLPLSATSFGSGVFTGCSALTLKVYQGSEGWKYALKNAVKNETIPISTEPALASVTVTPASVVTGGTSQAAAFDENGQALTSGVTWTVTPNIGITIDANGGIVVDSATAAGAYTVSASYNGVVKSATLTVAAPAPTLAYVSLNPASVTVDGTADAKSQAVAIDTNDITMTSGVTWSVAPANNGVAIDANGAITVSANAAAGNYTVTAHLQQSLLTKEAVLTVTRPATPAPTPTPTGNYTLSVLSAQVFPAGTTTYDASAASATSAQPGEIVALTVGFKNDTNAVLDIGAFGARLSYDKDKLELYNLFGNNAYQVGADFSGDWMTSPNVNANNDYVNIASFASGDPVTIAANSQVVMARFAFQVKSGAAAGATQFIFDAARSYVADGANQRVTLAAFAPFTLTVTTPTPTPTTPGPVNVPTIEKLSYPFANSHAGFGYAKDYRIPLERYEHIFGGKVLSKTLYKLAGLWGGNCYGVSTTSAFFHSNADIAANSFNADADAPLKLKLSDNSTTLYMSLQEFIELMQVSQNSPVIQNAYRTHKNQLADLCAAVDEFAKTGANPVVIAVFGPQGGHALLGYKLESVSATQSRLYVYDSNFPQDAGRYLTLSVNASGAATGWYYHLNDKYDWGSAFPGCWISYIPYADYCQVWDTRAAKSAGKPSKLELLTVNDDARIYDMEGMPIATIQDGELITGRDDMFPMITLGLTADGDGQQSQTAAVWLPTDLYTVERVASVSSADGPRLLGENDFKASVTHEEQSADVSTTATKVTFAVDDESQLNMVVIDEQQEGEQYDITLSSSLESAENAEIRLTGTVLAKALKFMQVSGEALYSGISAGDGSDLAAGVTLTIDGQTFVPAKASEKSVPVASFSANGGEGNLSPIPADGNGAFTMPECSFKAPAGMTFRCWRVNETEYQPGQTCVITGDITVVAQWKAAEAPVREYALDKLTRNGGTVSAEVTNRSGAGGVLMIAAYSDSGKFLRCALETVAESRIAKGSAATVTVTLDVSGAKTLRAVMLDAETQKPLSQPISG